MMAATGTALLHQARSIFSITIPKVPLLATSRLAFTARDGCFNRQLGVRQSGAYALPIKQFTMVFCCDSLNDLASKKCVPCNSKDIRPMSEQSAQELLPKIEGWAILKEDGTLKLHKSWKVKSFMKGLEFFQLVADVAEAEGHHPNLHLVGWNNVNIDIWTHSIGGLTENDFILAAKIDTLNFEQLLRRKVHRPQI